MPKYIKMKNEHVTGMQKHRTSFLQCMKAIALPNVDETR